MQLPLINDTPFQLQVSFYPVIELLEKKAEGPDDDYETIRAIKLLEEIKPFPEFRNGITDIFQIENNKKLIKKLLSDCFPEALTLNEIKAVSIPYRNFMFNRTRRFKNILKAAGGDFEFNIRDFDEHQFYVLSCCIILNEFYGTNLDFGRPLFYDIPTADGITRHYRILYNADYMNIEPTGAAVKLSAEDIDNLMNNYDDLALWKSKFPKESWIMKGFAIMTLYDATVENAVSLLKEKLLGLNNLQFHQNIESIFQSIYRIPDLRVGFTIYIKETNTFKVASFGQLMKSYILPDEDQRCTNDILCPNSYQNLIEEKEYFSVSDTSKYVTSNPESHLGRLMKAKYIESFILAPVVKDGVLLGILELVSPRAKELNSVNANKLAVVMPFLTESIERIFNEYQNRVQAIIQDNYTTIHNSVYWRFREEAEKYIDDRQNIKEYVLNEVVFNDVFPLYGQIDIKNSSDTRNSSVQIDLRNQLNAVLNILNQLIVTGSYHKEWEEIKAFSDQLTSSIHASTEQLITNYIEIKLHPLLHKITDPSHLLLINEYFVETDKETGSFYTYRRKYDKTISSINEKMAQIIDKSQVAAQAAFPHYYERFKTDGIEHNLYIGSSIAPDKGFDINRLYELRLWQLRVLCEMELAHYTLKPKLPYPLDVTSLVLVYHSKISIRFRMDEKRFDVDGTYNARFEIVKKRIDKAHVKGTLDRITDTGKLTIVYSSDAEEKEYRAYIALMQLENKLGQAIEKFDVEDLQGISGLKALRVNIQFPD